ncbi:MAG: YdcF family protein [Pseudomonadota bacterium]
MTAYIFLRSLLAPPTLHILLLLLGLWLLRRRPWLGGSVIALALLTLYLMATPWCAHLLARGLETEPPLELLRPESWQGAQVIVVPGGGRAAAPEFGGRDMPNYWTASRLRYGAALYRQSGLPLLVSGGSVRDEKEAEAVVMARSLEQDHIVNVRWLEARSRTTWENARFTRELLEEDGIHHVVLVTQALHMPRARMAFEHAGFRVTAAPVDFSMPDRRPLPQRLLPDPVSFVKSAQALHEYVGRLAYRARVWID